MELANITVNQALLALESNSAGLKLLAGQSLHASVQAQLGKNLVELLINNQRIQAHTEQKLEIGQKLKLVVEKVGDPIVLKAVNLSDKLTQAQLEQQILKASRNSLLKTALPKPASVEPLLKTLNEVLQNPASAKNLPQKLIQNLQTLSQSLSSPQQASTRDGLKQAIKQSGLFLEAHLAKLIQENPSGGSRNTLLTANDFKAALLKVATALNVLKNENPLLNQPVKISNTQSSPRTSNIQQAVQPTTSSISGNIGSTLSKTTQTVPNELIKTSQMTATQNNKFAGIDMNQLLDSKELGRQVEQALTKINLQQNGAISIEKNELPVWNLTIPIKDSKQIDNLDLSIFRDSRGSNIDEKGMWTIELTIDFESLGKIHAKVSLYNEEIMTSIWAEQTDTLQLIEDHLDDLKNQLAKTGMEIGCVQCLAGKPTTSTYSQANHSLVDLHL